MRFAFTMLLAVAVGATALCCGGDPPQDSSSSAEDSSSCLHGEIVGALLAVDSAAKAEASFAVDASRDPAVLTFARTELADLQRLDGSLHRVAVAIPPRETDLSRRILANTDWTLSILSGVEVTHFDEHFAAVEVLDGARALGVLQTVRAELTSSPAPDLAALADQMHVTLAEHLAAALDLQKRIAGPPSTP